MTRTRIGSDTARAWVRSLRLGNPYAKAILLALANYVNDDGTAFPGLETLNEDTEIAINTIIARLKWCETIGAVTISKCWVDENGNRNKIGRGRPSSWEIRFLLDADIEAIAAAANEHTPDRPLRGDAKRRHEEKLTKIGDEDGDVSLSPGHTLEESEPISSQSVANHLPITGASRILESEKTYPQTPFRKEAERGFEDHKTDQEEKTEKRWERFRSISYPGGILDLDKARAEFGRLSDDDQEAAIIGLPAYADVLRARKQKSAAAHLYFRRRVWRDLIGKVQESQSGPTLHDPKSVAGRALLALCDIWRWTPVRMGDGRVSHLKPITPQVLGMAQAPPKDQWACYEAGSREYAAWRNFFMAVFGRSPFARAEIEAPWEWPPSVEGKIYTGESAPPGTLSDADARALSGT